MLHQIIRASLALIVLVSACATSEQPARLSASTSLLAYNIYVDFKGDGWARRSHAFHAFLKAGQFDIIALQEVSETQLADILPRHQDYTYVVGERSDGHRGDQGWYEFTPVLWRKDRYMYLDHGSFWVSETPEKPGSILPDTKFHSRVFTWVELRDLKTGKDIFIGSVHIHGLRATREIEIILEQIERIAPEGPVILLGDFNMRPTDKGYDLITGKGFSDARVAAQEISGPERTMIIGDEYTYDTGGRLQTSREDKRIDFIFTCGIAEILSFTTQPNEFAPGVFASDHFALTAEVQGLGTCTHP